MLSSLRWSWMLLAALLLGACAGGGAPRLNDSDARIKLAGQTFGGRFDYLYIPTEGEVQDAAFVTTSKLSRSDLSRELATRLAPAELRPVRILVTGPATDKTIRVIEDALSFHRDGGLPYLEFLYIGDTSSAAFIEPLVRAKGGTFRHTPY